jgi:hypothetical protein
MPSALTDLHFATLLVCLPGLHTTEIHLNHNQMGAARAKALLAGLLPLLMCGCSSHLSYFNPSHVAAR